MCTINVGFCYRPFLSKMLPTLTPSTSIPITLTLLITLIFFMMYNDFHRHTYLYNNKDLMIKYVCVQNKPDSLKNSYNIYLKVFLYLFKTS